MQDWLITLIFTFVGGVLVLFVEYFVPKPDPAQRKKFWATAVPYLCLVLPLFIFQFLASLIVAATMKNRAEVVRVDWYANLYAVSALLWGWIWGTKVRPWLHSYFEVEG
jgi:hypothetical protein